MEAGPAEREFGHAARRYAIRTKVFIVLGVQIAALPVMPADRVVAAVVTLALTASWCTVLLFLDRPEETWVLVADLAVVVAVCLAQRWIDAPVLIHEQCGWVAFAAETCAIGYPLHFDRRRAAIGAFVIAGAYATGALLADEQRALVSLTLAAWILVTGLLAGYMAGLMISGVQAADAVGMEAEQAQREMLVAEARRRSEADHLATLHDTVAATLMMVGQGVTGQDTSALRAQAARDLEVLSREVEPGREEEDLAAVLSVVASRSGLEVEHAGDGRCGPLPPGVTQALAGAAGEALRNVARHSGTGRAELRLTRADDGVTVEIRDHGPGFAPRTRQGRGIRWSILERMDRCGGDAAVTSSAEGVTVRLSWTGGTA